VGYSACGRGISCLVFAVLYRDAAFTCGPASGGDLGRKPIKCLSYV